MEGGGWAKANGWGLGDIEVHVCLGQLIAWMYVAAELANGFA